MTCATAPRWKARELFDAEVLITNASTGIPVTAGVAGTVTRRTACRGMPTNERVIPGSRCDSPAVGIVAGSVIDGGWPSFPGDPRMVGVAPGDGGAGKRSGHRRLRGSVVEDGVDHQPAGRIDVGREHRRGRRDDREREVLGAHARDGDREAMGRRERQQRLHRGEEVLVLGRERQRVPVEGRGHIRCLQRRAGGVQAKIEIRRNVGGAGAQADASRGDHDVAVVGG